MARLLMLGAGIDIYRKYILETLHARGDDVALIDTVPRPWTEPFVRAGVKVDLRDRDAVGEAALSLHRDAPFDGVLTYDEAQVELTAYVAALLGLPGLSPGAAARCRDKRAMRAAFEAAGVPSARSVLVDDAEGAAAAAAGLGYPVVVKPRNLGGSIGVVRADDERELRAVFKVAAEAGFARIDPEPGVLVEQYLDGPEYSVESVVRDGRVLVCGITDKTVGFAPYFEELGHVCRAPGTGPHDQQLIDTAVAAHRALGITVGATHSELRMTADGPRMIEVAARLGGDQIPYVHRLASGVDMVALTVEALTGGAGTESDRTESARTQSARAEADADLWADTDPGRVRPGVAGIRMLYPQHDGVVRALGAPEPAGHLWHEMVWHVEEGRHVQLPPRGFLSRLGHVIARADDERQLRVRLDAAVASLRIEIEAAPAPGDLA
ncbi:ATP-grasp domain-containing protein [Streptomyces sp. NBC_01232]|uniref:ATP-grasp domain-containing protein n=1 Tax=Streptomyces sp. NBC_01232 TaxID=2903786 RepID=UPI002E0F4FD2|nr:ATP-grasp domain-containing protein [Streptomyces sp. NBC_01232]